MTREEAIEVLDNLPLDIRKCSTKQCGDIGQAIGMAINVLRPISRKQVEKAWRGEWIHKRSPYDYKIFVCKNCRKQISIQGGPLIFCPSCGAPMTDEAVQMVMERLEALKDGKGD